MGFLSRVAVRVRKQIIDYPTFDDNLKENRQNKPFHSIGCVGMKVFIPNQIK